MHGHTHHRHHHPIHRPVLPQVFSVTMYMHNYKQIKNIIEILLQKRKLTSFPFAHQAR